MTHFDNLKPGGVGGRGEQNIQLDLLHSSPVILHEANKFMTDIYMYLTNMYEEVHPLIQIQSFKL